MEFLELKFLDKLLQMYPEGKEKNNHKASVHSKQTSTHNMENISILGFQFFGIHLFPTLIVFIAMLPLFGMLVYSNQILSFQTMPFFNLILFIVSTLFSLFCIYISHSADDTLHKHLQTRKDSSRVLVDGVWKFTRHGNYFGEVGLVVNLPVWCVTLFISQRFSDKYLQFYIVDMVSIDCDMSLPIYKYSMGRKENVRT